MKKIGGVQIIAFLPKIKRAKIPMAVCLKSRTLLTLGGILFFASAAAPVYAGMLNVGVS
jgi:hypothetical protein